MKDAGRTVQKNATGGGAYFFGMVGALVYYLQVADGFWEVIFAFIKTIFWPGFLVYDVLKYIS